MEYKALNENDICSGLFAHFTRRQTVTKCYRKIGGEWVIRDVPFIDDWSEEEYAELIFDLKNTVKTGGAVFGALDESGRLKGFASVEPAPLGREREYLDLSSIHVSQDARGCGTGRALFLLAKDWARAHGAKKLYISAHSAVETQAFYQAMGCVDALEPNDEHVLKEPFDRQLECVL